MHTKSERQVEIETRLEELDAQRLAAKEEGAKLVKELHELLATEQAREYGLTPEQYSEAKAKAFPDREVQQRIDAHQAKQRVLEARANDNRKPEDVRKEAAKELTALNKEGKSLNEELAEAEAERVPLTRALKTARNVQHATAKPAPVGVKAKK